MNHHKFLTYLAPLLEIQLLAPINASSTLARENII